MRALKLGKKSMLKKRLLAAMLFASAAFFIQGCSSIEMASQQSDTDAKRFQADPAKAVVYVVQTGGFTSSLALFQVNVGGQFVGALTDSTYLRVVVEPGDTSISVSSQENQRSIRLRADAGSLNFVGASAALGLHTPRVSDVTDLDRRSGMDKVNNSRLAQSVQ